MIISSLFYITMFSVEAVDITISDGTRDVVSFTEDGNVTFITDSPEINVNNLDLIKTTYTLEGTQATLTLQVSGSIQDLGNLFDFESIEDLENLTLIAVYYQFDLTTSSEVYTIIYSNKTCNFTSGDEKRNLPSSDFSVDGNTLTVKFTLKSANETYESLDVESSYTKFSLIENTAVLLMDNAPNPPLTASLGDNISNVGSTEEPIQFYGIIETATGQPPYDYHWDFGDQSTANIQNPTHTYTKAGNYTFTFTVTDDTGATSNDSGTIEITQEGGDGSSSSNQMILFLAIILIIIVIGIIVIVWIIRRR